MTKKREKELIKMVEELMINTPKKNSNLDYLIDKIAKLDINMREKIYLGTIIGYGAKSTMMKGK